MTVSLRNTPGTAVPAGGGSTVSNKAAPTDEPYTLLAAIEYVNAGLALVGVPDTMPVTGSSVRPAGSGGKTEKLSACPLSVDRKSTRLNSSHSSISYAVFCLKKKKKALIRTPTTL